MDVLEVKTWMPLDVLYDMGELTYDNFMKLMNEMDEKIRNRSLHVLDGEKGMEVLRHICFILDRVPNCNTITEIKDLRDNVVHTVKNIMGDETIYVDEWMKDQDYKDQLLESPVKNMTYNDVKNDPDMLIKFYELFGINYGYTFDDEQETKTQQVTLYKAGVSGIPLRGEVDSTNLAKRFRDQYLTENRQELTTRSAYKVLRYKEKFPEDWNKVVDLLIEFVKNNIDNSAFSYLKENYNKENLDRTIVSKYFPSNLYTSPDYSKIELSLKYLQFSLPWNIPGGNKEIVTGLPIEIEKTRFNPISGSPIENLTNQRGFPKQIIQKYTEPAQHVYVMEKISESMLSPEEIGTGFLDWMEEYTEKYGELYESDIVKLRAEDIRKRSAKMEMTTIDPSDIKEKHKIKYSKNGNFYYVKDPNYAFSTMMPFNLPDSIIENFKQELKNNILKGIPYKGVYAVVDPDTKELKSLEYQIINKDNGLLEKKKIIDRYLLKNVNNILNMLYKDLYTDQYFLNAKASAIAFSESLKKVKFILRKFKKGEALKKETLNIYDYNIVFIGGIVKLINIDEHTINFKNYKDVIYKIHNEYMKDYQNYSKILVNTDLGGIDTLMIERKKIPTRSEIDQTINNYIKLIMLLEEKQTPERNMTVVEFQTLINNREKLLNKTRTEFNRTLNYLSNVFIANYSRRKLLYLANTYRNRPYIYQILMDLFNRISPINIQDFIGNAEVTSDVMLEPMIVEPKRSNEHEFRIDQIVKGQLPLFVYENNNEFVINRPDLPNIIKISKGKNIIEYKNAIQNLFRYNSMLPDFTFLYPDVFGFYCMDNLALENIEDSDQISFKELYGLEKLEGEQSEEEIVREISRNIQNMNKLKNNTIWNTSVKKLPPIGRSDFLKEEWVRRAIDRGVYYNLVFGNYLQLYNLSKELVTNYDKYNILETKFKSMPKLAIDIYVILMNELGINENVIKTIDSMTPFQLLSEIEEMTTNIYTYDGSLTLETNRPYDYEGINNMLLKYGIDINKLAIYNQEKNELRERYIKANQRDLTKKYEPELHTLKNIYKKEYDLFQNKYIKNKGTLIPVKMIAMLMDNQDNMKVLEYVNKEVAKITKKSNIEPSNRYYITTIETLLTYLKELYKYKKEYINVQLEMQSIIQINEDIKVRANLMTFSTKKSKLLNTIKTINETLVKNFNQSDIMTMLELLEKYNVDEKLDEYDYTNSITSKSFEKLAYDFNFPKIHKDEKIKKINLNQKELSTLYILTTRLRRLGKIYKTHENLFKKEDNVKKEFIKVINDIVLNRMRESVFVAAVNEDDMIKAQEGLLKQKEDSSNPADYLNNLKHILQLIGGIGHEYVNISNLTETQRSRLRKNLQSFYELRNEKMVIREKYDKELKILSKKMSTQKKVINDLKKGIKESTSEGEVAQFEKEVQNMALKNYKQNRKMAETIKIESKVSDQLKKDYLKDLQEGLKIEIIDKIKKGDTIPYNKSFWKKKYDIDYDNTNTTITLYDLHHFEDFSKLIINLNNEVKKSKDNEVYTIKFPNQKIDIDDKPFKKFFDPQPRQGSGDGKVIDIKENYVILAMNNKMPYNLHVYYRNIDPNKYTKMIIENRQYIETKPLLSYCKAIFNAIIDPEFKEVGGYRTKLTTTGGVIKFDNTCGKILRKNINNLTVTVKPCQCKDGSGFIGPEKVIHWWQIKAIIIDNTPIKNEVSRSGESGVFEEQEYGAEGYTEYDEYEDDREEQNEDYGDGNDEKEYDIDEDIEKQREMEKLEDIGFNEYRTGVKSVDEEADIEIDQEYYDNVHQVYNLTIRTFFPDTSFDTNIIPDSAYGIKMDKLPKNTEERYKNIYKKAVIDALDETGMTIEKTLVKLVKFTEVYMQGKILEIVLRKNVPLRDTLLKALSETQRYTLERQLITMAFCIIFYYNYAATFEIAKHLRIDDAPNREENKYLYNEKDDIVDYLGNVYDIHEIVKEFFKYMIPKGIPLQVESVKSMLIELLIFLGTDTKDNTYVYNKIKESTVELVIQNSEKLKNIKNNYVEKMPYIFSELVDGNTVKIKILNEIEKYYHGPKSTQINIAPKDNIRMFPLDYSKKYNEMLKELQLNNPELYNFVKQLEDPNSPFKTILQAIILVEEDKHFTRIIPNVLELARNLWGFKDPTHILNEIHKLFGRGDYMPNWINLFLKDITSKMSSDELFNYLDYEIQRKITGKMPSYGITTLIDDKMKKSFTTLQNYSIEYGTNPLFYFYYNLHVMLGLIRNTDGMERYNIKDLRNIPLPGYINLIISNLEKIKNREKIELQRIKSTRAGKNIQSIFRINKFSSMITQLLEILSIENCLTTILEKNIKEIKDFDTYKDDKELQKCKSYWNQIYQQNQTIVHDKENIDVQKQLRIMKRTNLRNIVKNIDSIIPISDENKLASYIDTLQNVENRELREICLAIKDLMTKTNKDNEEISKLVESIDCDILKKNVFNIDPNTGKKGIFTVPNYFQIHDKGFVDLATTKNIDLTKVDTTTLIDGVKINNNTTILVKNQNNLIENGEYIFTTKLERKYVGTKASGFIFRIKNGQENSNTKWIIINTPDRSEIGKDPIFIEKYTGLGTNIERNIIFDFIKESLFKFRDYYVKKIQDLDMDDYNMFLKTIEINIKRKLNNDEIDTIIQLSLQPKKLEYYLLKLSGEYSSEEYVEQVLIEMNNDYKKYYNVKVQESQENSQRLINNMERILARTINDKEKKNIQTYSSNSNYAKQYLASLIDKEMPTQVHQVNKLINDVYHTTQYKFNLTNAFDLDDIQAFYLDYGYSLEQFPNILDIYPYIPNVKKTEDNYMTIKFKIHLWYLNTLLVWNNIEPIKTMHVNNIDIQIRDISHKASNIFEEFVKFAYIKNGKPLEFYEHGFLYRNTKIPFIKAYNHPLFNDFKSEILLKYDTKTIHNKLGQLIENAYKDLAITRSLSSLDTINNQIKGIINAVWTRIINVQEKDLFEILLRLYEQIINLESEDNPRKIAKYILRTVDVIHSELGNRIDQDKLMKYKLGIRSFYLKKTKEKYDEANNNINALINNPRPVNTLTVDEEKYIDDLHEKKEKYAVAVNSNIFYTKIKLNKDTEFKINQIVKNNVPKKFNSPFKFFYKNLKKELPSISKEYAQEEFKEKNKKIMFDEGSSFLSVIKRDVKESNASESDGSIKITKDNFERLDPMMEKYFDDIDEPNYDIAYGKLTDTFARNNAYNKEILVLIDIPDMPKNNYPVGIYERSYQKIDSGYEYFLKPYDRYKQALKNTNDIYIYTGDWYVLKWNKETNTFEDKWSKYNDLDKIQLEKEKEEWIKNTTNNFINIIEKFNGKYVPEDIVIPKDLKKILRENIELVENMNKGIKYGKMWVENTMEFYKKVLAEQRDHIFIKHIRHLYGSTIPNNVPDSEILKANPIQLYNIINGKTIINIDPTIKPPVELMYTLPINIHVYFDESLYRTEDVGQAALVNLPSNIKQFFNEEEKRIAEKLSNDYVNLKNKKTVTPTYEEIEKRIQKMTKTGATEPSNIISDIRKEMNKPSDVFTKEELEEYGVNL